MPDVFVGRCCSLLENVALPAAVTSIGIGAFAMSSGLTSLDLSGFNTARVTNMVNMFYNTSKLETIYASNGWSTAAVTSSNGMFLYCTSLVGGQGTTYDENHIDKTYAHIDGGPSNLGYFTEKVDFVHGDVNGDHDVTIADVSALIDYLLYGTWN